MYKAMQSPGGTYMLKHTGIWRPNGLVFHKNPSTWVPFLSKSPQRGPILQKKNVQKLKSAIFEVKTPLEMGPDFENFEKSSQIRRFFS